MYKILVYSLENCIFSKGAIELFEDKNIKIDIITVSQKNKNNYKNKEINTFPQIYLTKENNKLLIGGYDDLKKIFDNLTNNLDKNLKYLSKFNWNKKNKLRLLKLILK